MAKRIVVAIWTVAVIVLAALLFAINLAVLGVALLVLGLAMGVAIAVWRPDRKSRDAAAGLGPAGSALAGSTAGAPSPAPRLGTPLETLVRAPRRARRPDGAPRAGRGGGPRGAEGGDGGES